MQYSNTIDSKWLQPFTSTAGERFFLRHFWLGFIAYSVGFALTSTPIVSKSICQLIQAIGLVAAAPSAVLLLREHPGTPYLKSLLIPYLLWAAIIIVRGWYFEYEYIKLMLFNGWFGVFMYFCPLLLFFPKNLNAYKALFKAITILAIIYLLLDLIFISKLLVAERDNFLGQGMLELFSKTLGIPAGFILLTYKYHAFKLNILAAVVLAATAFLALVNARRGLIFMSTTPLMAAYLIYLANSRAKFLLILFSLLFGIVLAIYGLSFFSNSSLFDLFKERALEDSRRGVEICLLQDLNTADWIFGRGLNGKYLCPEVHADAEGKRWVIETDYLNIILKGGLISLLLFLFMAIPAMIRGIFFSKNSLARAAGIWILLGLLNMYPSYVKTFTLNYLLIWISMGICYSNILLNLDERAISSFFRGQPFLLGIHSSTTNINSHVEA